MDFTEIHTRVCPKDQSEVTLTILYTKATCSRVSDKIQRFRSVSYTHLETSKGAFDGL